MQDHTIRSLSRWDLHFTALDVRPLWEIYPEPRIQAYASLIPEATHKHFLFGRALELLADSAARHSASTSGKGMGGIASWRPLPWDSTQIGLSAARVDLLLALGEYKEARQIKKALLADLLHDCSTQGIQHLTARVDCSDLSGIHALQSCGFELIDGIQTSACFVKRHRRGTAATRFEVRSFRPDDLEQVVSIARTSYVHDRFHADWAIAPEAADLLNAEWLRNSCAGMADHVVVAADESGVVAYVTCKLDRKSEAGTGVLTGTIVMVATAQRARGKGAASATTEAAVEWFASQGAEIVEVGTQLANAGAARVYQKCEFIPVSTTITFRALINADRSL